MAPFVRSEEVVAGIVFPITLQGLQATAGVRVRILAAEAMCPTTR